MENTHTHKQTNVTKEKPRRVRNGEQISVTWLPSAMFPVSQNPNEKIETKTKHLHQHSQATIQNTSGKKVCCQPLLVRMDTAFNESVPKRFTWNTTNTDVCKQKNAPIET